MTSGDRLPPRLPLTEAAQALRDELNARFGLNRRAVSVRSIRYGVDSALYLSILAPGIPLRKVARVAKRHERIHRDRTTGEVSRGANRFVDLRIEPNVVTPFLAPVLKRLFELPEGSPDEFHPVRFGRYRFEIARAVDPIGEMSFRLNGDPPYFMSPDHLSKYIARILAQSRQWRRLLALTHSKEP
jgi:hypothetical protein